MDGDRAEERNMERQAWPGTGYKCEIARGMWRDLGLLGKAEIAFVERAISIVDSGGRGWRQTMGDVEGERVVVVALPDKDEVRRWAVEAGWRLGGGEYRRCGW